MSFSPTTHKFEMELSHLDDKMEIGNSPYPRADDIDLDFDNVRQQSIDRSMADDIDTTGNDVDHMQADAEDMYNDDFMVDDEAMQPAYDANNDFEDLNMEFYEDSHHQKLDEEILDDEEGGAFVDMAIQQDLSLTDEPQQAENVEPQFEEIEEVEPQITETQTEDNTNLPIEDSQTGSEAHQQPTTAPEVQISYPEVSEVVGDPIEVIDFAKNELTDVTTGAIEHEHSEVTQATDGSDLHLQNAEYEQTNVTIPSESSASPEKASAVPSTTQRVAAPEDAIENHAVTDPKSSDQSTGQLHPITVVYLGQEMSLFPPMVDDTSATFFVSEPSLAYEPVEKLLASCRDILGESLEHDDELVLDVPALGLHVCEDSRYASQLTLSQIVEVYLTLSHNEHIENIEPLYCALSSRVCLASQYAYLAASATEGKHYSEIAADYVDSPEHGEVSFEAEPEDTQQEELEEQNNTAPLQIHQGDVHGSAASAPDQQELTSTTSEEDKNDAVNHATLANSNAALIGDVPEKADAQVTPSELITLQPDAVDNEADFGDTSDPQSAVVTDEQVAGDEYNHDHNEAEAESQHENVDEVAHTEPSPAASSHTVEGEAAADAFDAASPSEHIDGQQDADPDNYEIPEDLFEENIYGDVQDHDADGFNAQLESEMTFPTNNAIEEQAPADIPNNLDHSQGTVTGAEANEASEFGEDNTADDLDVFALDEDNDVPPVTPSKANGIKRKALEDEEELDFLDISTPEPKRNRAS